MTNQQLQSLAQELASLLYDGPLVEDTESWPEHFQKTAKNLKKPAASLVVNDAALGFQFLAIEPYTRPNAYLVMEMDQEGAEINLWVRYDTNDWENYGPKEDGDWD
jgi:hypothetical protein